MNLSAFGVESDVFPNIHAIIDFKNDSSKCKKSYFNPVIKDATYSLTKEEIKALHTYLLQLPIENNSINYTANKTDQPTSTTIIYTNTDTTTIKDYGLIGQYPLNKIYELVYKLESIAK